LEIPLPERSGIETDRLTIRLVEESDVPALFEINGDDEVTRFLPYETWRKKEDGDQWYQRMATRAAAGDVAQFVIVFRESQHIIGTCLMFRFEQASARAEIGYVLGRKYWGGGYMLEAMRGFVGFAFDKMNLRRLEAEIDPRNTASARLLERLGFVSEGLLRQRWEKKGEFTDSGLYGLLRSDWSKDRVAQDRRHQCAGS
jgi:RimJ/RimL family protein N-acetyltransferase